MLAGILLIFVGGLNLFQMNQPTNRLRRPQSRRAKRALATVNVLAVLVIAGGISEIVS